MIDISTYNQVNIDTSLSELLRYVRILTKSDAGTIYLKEEEFLRFMVFQNDSIDASEFQNKNIDITSLKIPLNEEGKNRLVAVNSFLNGVMINIEDVYQNLEYDLQGTKSFDKLFDYQTHSILTVPLQHPFQNEIIGVLQIINKKNNNTIGKFTKEDELFLDFVSSFASMSIVNVQNYITQLKETNTKLQVQIEDEIEKNSQKDALIYHTYKISQMNKMLKNISHQWRHPLGELGLNNMYLKEMNKDKQMRDIIDDSEIIIKRLSSIIDSFENIFDDSGEMVFFDTTNSIKKAILLVEHYLQTYKFEIKLDLQTELFLFGSSQIFSQIILALLQNSIDIFKVNKEIEPTLSIKTLKDDTQNIIEFEDNSGLCKYINTVINADQLKSSRVSTLNINIIRLLIEDRFGGKIIHQKDTTKSKYTIFIPRLEKGRYDKRT